MILSLSLDAISSHRPISCRASPHIPEIPREIPYRTGLPCWIYDKTNPLAKDSLSVYFLHLVSTILWLYPCFFLFSFFYLFYFFFCTTCLFEILSHLTLLSNTGIRVGSCLKCRLAFDRDVLSQFRSIAYFPLTGYYYLSTTTLSSGAYTLFNLQFQKTHQTSPVFLSDLWFLKLADVLCDSLVITRLLCACWFDDSPLSKYRITIHSSWLKFSYLGIIIRRTFLLPTSSGLHMLRQSRLNNLCLTARGEM